MVRSGLLFVVALVCCACAGSSKFGGVDEYTEVTGRAAGQEITRENAADIIERYTVEYEIPNPLYGPAEFSLRRVDPSHKGTIKCSATLLDGYSTEADILLRCPDSLDVDAAADCRAEYMSAHVREGTFRVRIAMESGFSEKSMNSEYWSIYLQNARGVMIEPNEIAASLVSACQDSVYSELTRLNHPRNLLWRDLTLYFNQVAFWGEDLLGSQNPYLLLVMTREQEPVVRVAWDLSKDPSQ